MTQTKQPNEFSRLESLIGKSNLSKIENTYILVVGLGGVGSYAAEALVRSGILNIIIVDYDVVDITNLNRQNIALHSTIGKYKVDVLKDRLLDINPNLNIKTYRTFFDDNCKDKILSNKIDFIVDCCDSVDSKKMLIKEALIRKIDIISSMGTANKLDPTKLEIVDIRKTFNDPLAKKIRKFINDEKIKEKVMVLSSTEVPVKKGNILGSTAFVPSSAGLLIASYVINKIISNSN